MSEFLDPLILEPQDDGRTWKVMQPFDYDVGGLGSGEKIQVPVGFITDLASIPRILWNILPPFGKYTRAAVLHDYLYQVQIYTRLKSDEILLEAMKVLSVGFFTRWSVFIGVRSGGWIPWMQHKREIQAREEKHELE